MKLRTNKKWNVFAMLEEAKKYSCRKKFRAESSYCSKLASKLGMFDIFTDHMKRSINKKGYWTKDLILKESIKYNTKIDFLKGNYAAYRAATNMNVVNEVCSHMMKPEQKRYWDKERIHECAKKYNKKVTFQKENTGAYAAARRLGIVDEICSHMVFKNDQLHKDSTGRICKKCKEFKIRKLMCTSSNSKSRMSSLCRDCKAIYSKERLIISPEKYNFHTANRRAMHKKATPSWVTKDHKIEILYFYKEAKQKTASLNIIHEVDHIIPIRSKKVCGLHVPWNLQVITRDQNRSKSNGIIDHV